jgi:hypothetical protein
MNKLFTRLIILIDMVMGNNIVGKYYQPGQKDNRSFEFKNASQFSGSFSKYSN